MRGQGAWVRKCRDAGLSSRRAPSEEGRGGQGGGHGEALGQDADLEERDLADVPLKPSGSVPPLGRGTIIGMGRWDREFLESGNVESL